MACRSRPTDDTRVRFMSPLDTWRCAGLLLASHGPEAAHVAVGRAMALHTAGDEASGSDWLRILMAISDLGRSETRVDERHH
jgi:hypothetical protein